MDFLKKQLDKKVGLPPGELSYTGDEKAHETSVILRQYNEEEFHEVEIKEPTSISIEQNFVNWIEVNGFSNLDFIKEIGSKFNLHTLFLEDTLNSDHIPKYEEHDNCYVFIMKSFFPAPKSELKQNHICIFLQNNTVLAFQEFKNDFLKAKIGRIKQAKGKARHKKADYLFFVLIDAFIDSYYSFFDQIRDKLDKLEEELLINPTKNMIEEIHDVKKELSSIRKNLFPLKEALLQIVKDEPDFIIGKNNIYFKDSLDHVKDLIEYYNTFTEFIKSLVVLNDTNLNNNINKVMKLLTIIATIFIPLTFIAGIYGMNFKYMPELEWYYGYPIVLIGMTIIGGLMFLFMKKKKWFN